MPLFLELVRQAGESDPELALQAFAGLARYQRAARSHARGDRPVAEAIGGASLRDCGGSGRPIVLVPSLLNPPEILDLDPACSLAQALRPSGQVFLLDWGPASARLDLDVSAHVTERLLPMVERFDGPAILIGYCLGGTMALAAAALDRRIRAVVTLAAPWHFAAYPAEARKALEQLWSDASPTSEQLGVLPMEVLQAAFWSLDLQRVVAKFAKLADRDASSAEFRRFVALEDWANGGEALPFPAARELLVELFGRDRPGRGKWLGGALPACPSLHVTATADRIVPALTAPSLGERLCSPAGHVGMIVGRSAPQSLHAPLRQWLEALSPRG